jgi:hypothetical protein
MTPPPDAPSQQSGPLSGQPTCSTAAGFLDEDIPHFETVADFDELRLCNAIRAATLDDHD